MSYKYAELDKAGVVQQVIMSPVVLHFTNDLTVWVEVSTAHPSPDVGWKHNGDGTFSPPDANYVNVQAAKGRARKAIDVAASMARRKIMPDEYGQMELYREKYEQAIDFLCSQDVVKYSDFPLLEIEARILDIPMKNIADNVIKRRSEWISKLTKIEELRLYGKAHIGFCHDVKEVELLVSHLSHKLEALG